MIPSNMNILYPHEGLSN